jgi:hypothetical protein
MSLGLRIFAVPIYLFMNVLHVCSGCVVPSSTLQMPDLLQLSCLTNLTLHHVCDKDVPYLLQITHLRHLVMHSTYITEAGVEQLTGLQQLTMLGFDSDVLNWALDAKDATWKFSSPRNTNKVCVRQQAVSCYDR